MHAVFRHLNRLTHRIGLRPLPFALVVLCAVTAVYNARAHRGDLVARAVTDAPVVPHAVAVTAKVQAVHVVPGQRVWRGDLLVTLSAPELQAARDEIVAEQQRVRESLELTLLDALEERRARDRGLTIGLAKARRDSLKARAIGARQNVEAEVARERAALAQQELSQGLIAVPDARGEVLEATHQTLERYEADDVVRAELTHVTELTKAAAASLAPERLSAAITRVHEAELAVLTSRASEIERQIGELAVRAAVDGVVADVLPAGTIVPAGATCVTLTEPYAQDVVTFLEPAGNPQSHAGEVAYSVALADGRECRGRGELRSAGRVAIKPGQLAGPMGLSGYGFPMRVRLDPGCRLPIGQVVELTVLRP